MTHESAAWNLALGVGVLDRLLAARYSAGASLRHLAKVTGLGWARLCCEIDAVGIAVRTGTDRAKLQYYCNR
ncbi:MAG TPA: hypothetical protein VHH52_03000 [Pseudonocardiaceae bacterium]|nr:hypothetical protein [Pseudonocardiaceae bacterium]